MLAVAGLAYNKTLRFRILYLIIVIIITIVIIMVKFPRTSSWSVISLRLALNYVYIPKTQLIFGRLFTFMTSIRMIHTQLEKIVESWNNSLSKHVNVFFPLLMFTWIFDLYTYLIRGQKNSNNYNWGNNLDMCF